MTFLQRLKQLAGNWSFIFICLGLTAIYFIVTGIQYWITDYMITYLKFQESQVYVSFAIVSITGPVFGVVTGGNVTSCLGGYNSKKALQMTIVTAALCVASAAPIPFVSHFWTFSCLLWTLLFLGGSMLPGMTGIMLSTVDSQFKTSANSMANLFYNLLGYLPAPTVYGLIHDYGDGNNAQQALGVLMFMPVISLISIIAAGYLLIKKDILGYKKQELEARLDRDKKEQEK